MKRVLVALDASARAPTVLAAAARVAERASASLVLFRAVDPPGQLAAAERDLARLASAVPRAHVETIRAAFAAAPDGICRAARDLRADLIVLGSDSDGATTAQVLDQADRDVLVVRTGHARCSDLPA